jgi:uncharacterized protein with FMN-binding domain
MKKLFLSSFLILSFTAYAVSQHISTPILPPITSPSGNDTATNAVPETIPIVPQPVSVSRNYGDDEDDEESSNRTVAPTPILPTKKPTPMPMMTPAQNAPSMPMMGKYKNGTYTGNAVAQYYGDVQVQAVISGGKLVDVLFLQYPNHGNSSEVNAYALPILRSEAITAQSANIDAVSGASETSPAFIASLSSALKQALI